MVPCPIKADGEKACPQASLANYIRYTGAGRVGHMEKGYALNLDE